MSDTLVGQAQTVLNPDQNSGEHVELICEIHDNGDATDNVFYVGHFVLNSYGSQMTATFCADDLADKLEKLAADIRAQTQQAHMSMFKPFVSKYSSRKAQ